MTAVWQGRMGRLRVKPFLVSRDNMTAVWQGRMGLGQRSSHLAKPNRFSGFLLPQCYQAVLGVNFHFPVCPVFEWHLLELVVLLPRSRHEPANGITKFQLLENKCNIKKSINTWHHSWGWLLKVMKIIFPIAFSRFALTCLAICCLRNVLQHPLAMPLFCLFMTFKCCTCSSSLG